MTEPAPVPRQSNSLPRGSIPYVILGLLLLLAADYIVVVLIFKKGLIPTSLSSATPTRTETPPAQIASPEAGLQGAAPPEPTLMLTPPPQTPSAEIIVNEIPLMTETPVFTRTPAPLPTFTPSLTPVLDSCQYKLKPGPEDFLYAIYWNWHINKKIPELQDYYAGITCAALLSNKGCAYQAADPDTTQPGWILVLPGVSPNICMFHGGTPVS